MRVKKKLGAEESRGKAIEETEREDGERERKRLAPWIEQEEVEGGEEVNSGQEADVEVDFEVNTDCDTKTSNEDEDEAEDEDVDEDKGCDDDDDLPNIDFDVGVDLGLIVDCGNHHSSVSGDICNDDVDVHFKLTGVIEVEVIRDGKPYKITREVNLSK